MLTALSDELSTALRLLTALGRACTASITACVVDPHLFRNACNAEDALCRQLRAVGAEVQRLKDAGATE